MRTLDNHSALSRAKAITGFFKVSNPSSVSGYVLMVKIKKALQSEFNAIRFAMYVERQNFSKNTKVSRLGRIDKMITRLDQLPAESLNEIYQAYESRGVIFMAEVLDFPLAVLMQPIKLKNKIEWKKNGKPLSFQILQVEEISHQESTGESMR
jgi:hypothetical protein